MTPALKFEVPAEAVIISAPSAKVTSAAKLAAPSTSIASKLAVPSISASPEISRDAPSISPVTVILSTNASFHLTPVVPKSTSLSDCGPKILSAT